LVKERKKLGLGLLSIAALFLFNPPLAGIWDLLPDVIGYLLLFVGLRDLSVLNYHMEDARRGFGRMIAVSAAQIPAVLWIMTGCQPKGRPDAILLLTFTVSCFELLFARKAFSDMFQGFLYLGSRHGSEAVFKRKKKRRYYTDLQDNATTAIATFTVVFLVIKALCATLPELAALTLDGYDEGNAFRWLYNFITLLRGTAMLISLPFCMAWLVKFLRYMHALLRDIPFLEAIREKYRAEILPRDDIFLKRALRIGAVILSIGICLSLDVYINFISFLPDFLCPIVLLIGFFLLKPYLADKGKLFPLCAAAHAISSAIVYQYSIYFYDHFTMSLALYAEKAYLAYCVFCALKIVDAIFFFAMMASLLPCFKHIAVSYTGFVSTMADGTVLVHEEKTSYIHDMLNKRIRVLWILSALTALGSIFYILFVRTVSFSWLVEFLSCLALGLYLIGTFRALLNEVEAKYLLS